MKNIRWWLYLSLLECIATTPLLAHAEALRPMAADLEVSRGGLAQGFHLFGRPVSTLIGVLDVGGEYPLAHSWTGTVRLLMDVNGMGFGMELGGRYYLSPKPQQGFYWGGGIEGAYYTAAGSHGYSPLFGGSIRRSLRPLPCDINVKFGYQARLGRHLTVDAALGTNGMVVASAAFGDLNTVTALASLFIFGNLGLGVVF